MISNHNDILFIHNNVNILKDKEVDELVKSTRKEITQEVTPLIFDITKATKELTINQIKDIIIKTLLPDFDASENDSNAFNGADYENNMNEENKNATHKNCFGLDNRQRNEKLSKDQILFLKNHLAEEKSLLKRFNINTKYLSLHQVE